MKIHREGYTILISLLVLLVVANILILTLMSSGQVFFKLFFLSSVILYLMVLWFFRSPVRSFNPDENSVIAPADGKIVAIEEIRENEYFKDSRLQVSIFMSPLNVHVNIFPITGRVKYYRYHPGDYLVAWHPKASERNEHNSVVIGNSKYTVLVRQVAGAVARRIVCYAKSGEQVLQGQELGFIKFGSRVDLLLPTDVKLNVKLGQKVSGKTSVIASFV
ncbi:MAG: phosphatidylserine decarboxylase family protein [Bacteroidales bacterium]